MPAWRNIYWILIATMAGAPNWKSIILNLFSWLPLVNCPTSMTPSGEGTGPAILPRCHHQSRMKHTSANMVTITMMFTVHICNWEQMRTHHCPMLRPSTKMGFCEPHHEHPFRTSRASAKMRFCGPCCEPVAFNSAPFNATDPPAG